MATLLFKTKQKAEENGKSASFNFYYWEGMPHQGEHQFLSFALSSQFHFCCLVLFASDLQHTFISKYGGRMHPGTLMKSKIITNGLKPQFIYFPKGASRNINKRRLQVEV